MKCQHTLRALALAGFCGLAALAAQPQSAPPAPVNFQAYSLPASTLHWHWTDGPVETSYEIHDGNDALLATVGANVAEWIETGLAENTPYTRHVHAINASGASPASNAWTRPTLVHTATAADFSLQAVSGYQVDITVVPPPNATTGNTRVSVQRSTDNFASNWGWVAGTGYTRNDTAVIPNTLYYYRIVFANSEGAESGFSPSTTVTTPAAPPPVPVNFQAYSLPASTLHWHWTDGPVETSYEIHDGNDALLATVGANVAEWIETGLAENTPYTRHVHAINASGTSPASNSWTRPTLVHNATAADFSLTPISGEQVRIDVVPPTNATAGLTRVDIKRSSTGNFLTDYSVVAGTGYVRTNSGLSPHTTYYYQITFANSEGLPSAASPSKTTTTLIGTPAAFQGTGQSTTSVRWSWNDVAGETGYEVHDDAHVAKGTLEPGVLSFTEGGFSENQAVRRHVHAIEAAGPGGPSATFTGYALIHDAATTDFAVAAVTSNRARITVTPPPNETAGSTACEIQRSTDDAIWTSLGALNVYTRDDTGVAASTLYYFRIRFRNGNGVWTTWSPSRSITMPAVPPPAPSGFAGIGQSSSSIKWTWQNVAGETGYEVHDDAQAVRGTVAADVLSFTETGLAENSTFTRHVHAVNSGGVGAASTSATALTRIHDAAVSDFTMTVVSRSRIDVSVKLPPNATAGSTGCEVQRSTTGTKWTTLKAFSNAYLASDTGVSLGKAYYYRIRYRGIGGTAGAYSAFQKITVAVPAAPTGMACVSLFSTTSSLYWTWNDVLGETAYQIHDAAEVLKGTVGSGQVLVVESGLSENTAYSRHVHAVNGVGVSTPSAAASRCTLVHTPVAGDLTAVAVSPTQIDVSVAPPPNATTGSTGCEIQRSSGGAEWATIKPFSNAYSWSDAGLASGVTYSYRIRYQNGEAVATAYSPIQTVISIARPVITTASKKVRCATPSISGTADLGTVVTVYFNGTAQGSAISDGGTWNFTSPVQADNTYIVTARASSGTAQSAESDPITVTVDVTPPEVPANIRTQAYNNTIDVEWDASTSSDVAGYLVWRKTETDDTWFQLTTTGMVGGTKYRDSTALNGVTYFYRVVAVDDALPE